MKFNRALFSQEILIAYVCIVVAGAICALIFAELYPFFHHIAVQNVPLIVERSGGLDYNLLVYPKPIERFTFLSLACFLPVLTLLSVLYLDAHKIVLSQIKFFRSKIVRVAIPLCLLLTLIYPLYNSEFIGELLSIYRFDPQKNLMISTGVILIAAYFLGRAVCLWQVKDFRSSPPNREIRQKKLLIWLVLIMATGLNIVAFRLYNIHNVSLVSPVHFDAAIYALSQVVRGKTLLVDLPSQYGLFAEILAPVFRIIGASIKSITSVFAIMQLISTFSLFFVLSQCTRKSWLLLLVGGLALILITFSTPLFLMHDNEPYFQYWPIRFFWPSLSVLAFYFFSEKKGMVRAFFISLIGALGIFWNVDSGLFIAVAFGGYLGAQWMLALYESKNTKAWSQLIVLHITVIVVVLAGLFYYLMWKSHSTLNIDWLLQYQKTFYQMGFMALPLPLNLHPWMSVLGIYLLGFIYSLYSWVNHTNRQSSDIIFFISLLGLGLFTYYEGRAHTNNLIQVCWPAVMVSLLITYQIFQGVQLKRLPKTYLHFSAATMGFYLICATVFLYHTVDFYRSASEIATEGLAPKEKLSSLIQNELKFIKKHSFGNAECLILSKRPSTYYVESQLSSPVKGPGLVEMVLQSDQDKLMTAIATQRLECIFYGIGKSETAANIDFNQLLQRYTVVDKNSEGTMLFLRPKSS